MNILHSISKESISVSLCSRTKPEVIEELLDLAVQTGRIPDRKHALKSILEREKKMSTGMPNGLAIPHGKTDTVESLVAAVGISKEGIDFHALDGNRSYIFILSVSPANRTGPHIQFLAEISRLLTHEDRRQAFLDAESAAELHQLLNSG